MGGIWPTAVIDEEKGKGANGERGKKGGRENKRHSEKCTYCTTLNPFPNLSPPLCSPPTLIRRTNVEVGHCYGGQACHKAHDNCDTHDVDRR
jgi:hypothetical protein